MTDVVNRDVATRRLEVEDFLFAEAALLDTWDLETWLELFEPDAQYYVPATDRPSVRPDTEQMLVSDTYPQLVARVQRLQSRNAHAERPRSRTRRMITNVRVTAETDDVVQVEAAFAVHRFKEGRHATYVGRYEHVLFKRHDGLRFRVRAAILDHELLSEEGRLSIVL